MLSHIPCQPVKLPFRKGDYVFLRIDPSICGIVTYVLGENAYDCGFVTIRRDDNGELASADPTSWEYKELQNEMG